MKVSIITATYNSSSTIAGCISSVNNQTWPDIEHIVIDGDSKDNTLNIIRSTPNRVAKIISEPDNGIYDALNKGIGTTEGDLIGILNSDDEFYSSGSVEKIVNSFKREKVDAVYGKLIFTDSRGKLVRIWNSRPFINGLFAKSWTPAHPTFYCTRQLYETFGLYKTNYKIAADVELMIRFMEVHNISTYYIDEILVNMRVGGISNRGVKSTVIITKEIRRALKENGLKFNIAKYLFYKGFKIRQYLTK